MWNHLCVNALKETVLHRTVPRHRVNVYPYTYGTVPYRTVPKSSCKRSLNAALETIDLHLDLVFFSPIFRWYCCNGAAGGGGVKPATLGMSFEY